MPTLLIAAALCMVVSLLVATMAWMTVIRLRDRRDASEVVPLEVAVCIRKNNGDDDCHGHWRTGTHRVAGHRS